MPYDIFPNVSSMRIYLVELYPEAFQSSAIAGTKTIKKTQRKETKINRFQKLSADKTKDIIIF